MTNDNGRPDILRFVILIIVLIATLFIIALLRPLIFDRIVPAILGEGGEAPTTINETDDLGTGGQDTIEEEEQDDSEIIEEADEEEAPLDIADESDETIPVDDSSDDEQPFPTARPAIRHTVEAGETVAQLATRYGVSADLIQQANQLDNINRITAGDVLVIPQP